MLTSLPLRAALATFLPLAALLLLPAPVESQAANRVKDIRSGSDATVGLRPRAGATIGNVFLFNSETQAGLWKSDTTAAGTTLLDPSISPRRFARAGNTVFFPVARADGTDALWRTDGTSAGTFELRRFSSLEYSGFADVAGTLFFSVDAQLWKSDGSVAGTVLVKEIRPGPGSYLYYLTKGGGLVFFTANDGVNGRELWRSDGTASGTFMVKDLIPGGDNDQGPYSLVEFNGLVFFGGNGGSSGSELWKSDGTGPGTTMVSDVVAGPGSSFPRNLTPVGSTLYFAAYDPPTFAAIWKTDGTAAGTVLLKDIRPTPDFAPPQLANVAGTLFFVADDGSVGRELWKSDGTSAGTVLVKDTQVPGSCYGSIVGLNATLLLTCGNQLWASDGTTPGTVLLREFADVRFIGSAFPFTDDGGLFVNGVVVFAADDGLNGGELWKTDGTSAGTAMLKNLALAPSSEPRELVDVAGTLFFTADDGVSGRELWKSDGAEVGTVLVKDILSTDQTVPQRLTAVGDRLFFAVDQYAQRSELWRSDGTAAGTVALKTLDTGANPLLHTSGLTDVGGALFFSGPDLATLQELWKSGGTPETTVLVKDFPGSSSPEDLADVDGTLFYTADVPDRGRELCRSDGTPGGTGLVRDIVPGAASPFEAPFVAHYPAQFTAVDGVLYFLANDGANGLEVWRSDGTEAGTRMLKDVFAGPDAGMVPYAGTQVKNVDGTLFFVASDGITGRELWRSDGTTAGTVLVKDIRPGPVSSLPDYFYAAAVGGKLFFAADDGVNGVELWESDGTEAGTVMVKDIRPGPDPSRPGLLTAVNGRLFFVANDGANGFEMWESDGTPAVTRMVQDIYPGAQGAAPSSLTPSGAGLFFVADDGVSGRELWLIPAELLPVGISVADAEVAEGNVGTADAVFTLSLSSVASDTVTVGYATGDGSAAAGGDYDALSGSVTFPPGTLTQTVRVPVRGDTLLEKDETFFVALRDPVNAALDRSRGRGTIRDDDRIVSIEDRAVAEGAARNAAFRIVLSAPRDVPVTVAYATADGTATAGSDYEGTSGTLVFTPGRTSHSIYVPILADSVVEGDETFTVTLSAAINAALGRAQATGTIADPPLAARVPMYRAYNRSADYHFFTTELASKDFAVAALGYQDESTPVPFQVLNTMEAGSVPLFRMYNPNLGRHYYTAEENSRNFLMGIGMVYERDEGFVHPLGIFPPPGAKELFRLYNNNSGTHLFTADAAQKDGILALFPGVWVSNSSVGFVFAGP